MVEVNVFEKIVKEFFEFDGFFLRENISYGRNKEIDLLGWSPPEDWGQRILRERVVDGTSVITANFKGYAGLDKPLSEAVLNFVNESKEQYPFVRPKNIPRTVLILACIKNKSPLPSAFWRDIIFKN